MTRLEEWRVQAEDHLDDLNHELLALRALTGLMSAHDGNNVVCISELAFLIDPIIERQKALIDELKAMIAPS